MDQILFCIHDKCTAASRLLLTMADVPKHNDKTHKVVQFKEFKNYVIEKYGDTELQKMQKITTNEKAIKDAITKTIKEVKEKLDIFEINEIKKMPSLQQLSEYVWTVRKTENLKDITNDLLKTVVEFQVEKIPKYGFILDSIDDRINKLKSEVLGMLKAQQYDLQITTMGTVKFTWSDQFKANIYQIKDDVKKEIEATTSFLGWSFACLHQQLTQQKRWEIKLEITEVENKGMQTSQLGQSQVKKSNFSFAVGITHQKTRQVRGYEQQDLSTIGHGFYVIRSDGWTCHNADKKINWQQGLAFTPECGAISVRFDASDGDLTFEQGKNKYQMKVEKSNNEVYLFCAHLKGCKAKILD